METMQERELDNLINGLPSKMAMIPDSMPLNRVTRDYVKQHEEPTPPKIVTAAEIWIDRCRKLGMSEKNIKKSVLKRFNIKMVK
jgi:hypothetical protein